jgi:hypothetical protein
MYIMAGEGRSPPKFPQPYTNNLEHGVILGYCLYPANGFHGNLGILNG